MALGRSAWRRAYSARMLRVRADVRVCAATVGAGHGRMARAGGLLVGLSGLGWSAWWRAVSFVVRPLVEVEVLKRNCPGNGE